MEKFTIINYVNKRKFYKYIQVKEYPILKKSNKLFDIDEGNITLTDTMTAASLKSAKMIYKGRWFVGFQVKSCRNLCCFI